MFVADISITDLQKIFEARLVLEGFCARLAAQRVTAEQLVEMEVLVQDLQRVKDGDARALMDIDEGFTISCTRRPTTNSWPTRCAVSTH
jgi:DNA-binding GntR family transcriptional regulator